MRLTWLAYQYREWDGYGRYSNRMIRALQRAGVNVTPRLAENVTMPDWMQRQTELVWDTPVISCLPPFHLNKLPKGVTQPHWLLTMTEGSNCPVGWAEMINRSGIERVIVPCEHNAQAFRNGGVQAPISVIAGGTEPDEFSLRSEPRPNCPYTFLALADRGHRKGFSEVYSAFYKAFGGKTTGVMDVRLMLKCLPGGNDLITEDIMHAEDLDKRLLFNTDKVENMADLYAQVDCFAIPSRSEGWGMPPREAAMSGLPVITQRYSGMDDGHTEQWAYVVEKGEMQPVEDTRDGHMLGEWRVCDRDELAAKMRYCYDYPQKAQKFGLQAADWLRANQTWSHSANALLQLLQQEGALEREREYA